MWHPGIILEYFNAPHPSCEGWSRTAEKETFVRSPERSQLLSWWSKLCFDEGLVSVVFTLFFLVVCYLTRLRMFKLLKRFESSFLDSIFTKCNCLKTYSNFGVVEFWIEILSWFFVKKHVFEIIGKNELQNPKVQQVRVLNQVNIILGNNSYIFKIVSNTLGFHNCSSVQQGITDLRVHRGRTTQRGVVGCRWRGTSQLQRN